MKQFFPLFLTVLLICALTACGVPAPVSGGSSSSQSTAMGSGSSQESNRSEVAEVPSSEAPVQESVSAPESQQAASPTAPASGGKTLIAYFSLWGNVNYPDGVDATTSASIVIDNSRFGTTEYVARMISRRSSR